MPVSQNRALDEAIAALVHGTQRDPFAILGPHPEHLEHPEHLDGKAIVVRAFQPAAKSIELHLVSTDRLLTMEKADPVGLFTVRLKADATENATTGGVATTSVVSGFSRTVTWPDYRLRITYPGDQIVEIDDPYRYGRVLTDFDLHLLSEGTHHRAFEKLGAHRITVGTTTGVHFAV